MKIYNRQAGRFGCYWNANDEVDEKGKPKDPKVFFQIEGNAASPDLPPKCAEHLLANWPRKFTADKKALDAELELKRKFEEVNRKNADLENRIGEIAALVKIAGDPKNKKAAQAAAEKLDALLSIPRGAPTPTAAVATPAPSAAPKDPVASEQAAFESPA